MLSVVLLAILAIVGVAIAFAVSVFRGQKDALEVQTQLLEKVSASEEKYRGLFENSLVGILRYDLRTGSLLEVNKSSYRILRASNDEYIERALGLGDSNDGAGLRRMIEKSKSLDGFELLASSGKGKSIWLSISALVHESSQVCDIVLVDISEQKKSQVLLKRASFNIIEAEERERKRVSRELHDGVNQLLSVAKKRMTAMVDTASAGAKKNAEVRRLVALVSRAIADVRAISRNLRPAILDDLGLVAAIRTLAEEHRVRRRITVTLEMTEIAGSVGPEVELALYRMVQEALTNIEKHSRAKNISVELMTIGANIHLKVVDDGRGFRVGAPQKSRSGDGLGLVGMKERAELLGGTFKLRSAPGRGTSLEVVVPVTENHT